MESIPSGSNKILVALNDLYLSGRMDRATIEEGKTLLTRWLKEGDVLEVLGWCRERNYPFESGFLSGEMFRKLAKDYPQQVKEQFQATGSRHYRNDAARGILDCEWSAKDKQEFFLSIQPDGSEFAQLNLSLEFEVDPEAAASLAASADAPDLRSRLLEVVMLKWAQKNAAVAMNWTLQKFPEGSYRDRLMGKIIADGFPNNRAEGFAALEQIARGPVKNDTISRIFDDWARQKPTEALNALETMSVGSERSAAIAACAMALPTSGVTEANRLLALASSKSLQNMIVRETSVRLASDDPVAALQWAQSLTAGDLQNSALNFAYQTWSAKHPAEAAASVVDNWQISGARSALETVLPRLAKTDPVATLEVLGRLPSDDQPAVARSLLDSSGNFFSGTALGRLKFLSDKKM